MDEITQLKQRLKKLLIDKAVVCNQKVTLSSGVESNIYIDARLVTLLPEGAYLVAKIILNLIKADNVDLVAGLTLGADPIVSSLAVLSWEEGKPITAAIVRKSAKKHGKQKQVEGPVKPNQQAVVVEDVVTTGSSALKAAAALEEIGCQIVKIISIVDRLQGGRQLIEKQGYFFQSIFTIKDLL
jgi:orotate phosphoribosyltransferase